MALQKKLIIYGSVLLAISLITYTFMFLFISNQSLVSVSYLVGAVLFTLHQIASWWILYQFAITRKQMSNRLHIFNKAGIFITVGFGMSYLILVRIIGLNLQESSTRVSAYISIILMLFFIFVQENNTNNFINLNLHKKTNQSKKSLNQNIGFGTTWILINIIWFSIGLQLPLTAFVFMFILLMLIQNSLAYTTYGQSKYWNTTYEVLFLIYFIVVALELNMMISLVSGYFWGLVFMMRLWKGLGYNRLSQLVGIVIFAATGIIMIVNPFELAYTTMNTSSITPYVMMSFVLAFIIAFVTQEPKFIKKLMKK